jgi:hypothetical protein
MNRSDADGRYLWSVPENWTKGLPGAELCVEIGDDHSRRALHCVIPSGHEAICGHFELAEHARTQGTTLRLEKDATLTIGGSAVLSKDRESWFHVDGTVRCLAEGAGFRVGGPWGRPDVNEPANAHVLIGPSGALDAWFVGINTTHRSESAPSAPWGPRFFARSTDSEIIVNGGKLAARQGLRVSTCDARRSGKLKLCGEASFTTERDATYGVDVWCGTWEIDGSRAQINVGDVEFWGNKFQDAVNTKTKNAVGSGVAVLKLTGDGISTIRARTISFVGAAVLDVSELKIPGGTYRIMDGDSLGKTNLQLAAPMSADKWRIQFDRANGDLMLIFAP